MLNPDYYHGRFYSGYELSGLLRYLSFTNQVWNDPVRIGSQGPYWSLGYEVPYYIGFGLFTFLSNRWRWVAIAIWALLFGPKVFAYGVIWLVGALLYPRRYVLVGRLYPGPTLIVLLITFAAPFVIREFGFFPPLFPVQDRGALGPQLTSFVYAATIALLTAANILCAAAATARWMPSPALKRVIRWISGGTFTLYLAHESALHLVEAAWPTITGTGWKGIVGIVIGVSACYLLAEIGERRKQIWTWLFRKLPGLRGRRPQQAVEALYK